MATPPPGSLIYNGILNPTEEQRGFARLPQLDSTGQASYSAPAPVQDPVTVFNLKLMDLLGKAQQANSGNAKLAGRASELQIGQTERSMAPASELGLEGMRPGDALNAREREAELYNPEVRALNDRMQLNNEAVSRFESTIKAAKDWGEEYYKAIKPDDATVQAVQMQMRAGIKPSEAILDKVRTSLTQADWDALAAAGAGGGSSPTSIKEYEYAKTQGYTGTYDQWLTHDASRSGGGSGSGDTLNEREDARRKKIIADTKSLARGEDQKISPLDYLQKAGEYQEAGGKAETFLLLARPEDLMTAGNAAWVRSQLVKSGREG